MSDVPLRIRPMAQGDRPFVETTLTRSICDVPAFHWVPGGVARRVVRDRVATWLRYFKVAVAAAECDDEELLGFMAYASPPANTAPGTILYLYVKESLRRMGVGWALLTLDGQHSRPETVTALHWSRHCETLCLKHPGIRYRPTLLRDRTRKEEMRRIMNRVKVTLVPPLSSQ